MSANPKFNATPHKILSTAVLAEELPTKMSVSALAAWIDHHIAAAMKDRVTADELIARIHAWGAKLFGMAQVDHDMGCRQFWSVRPLSALPFGLLADARFTKLDPNALAKCIHPVSTAPKAFSRLLS